MASQPRLALAVSGMDALLWKPEDSEKEGEREGDAASWRTSADGLLDMEAGGAAATTSSTANPLAPDEEAGGSSWGAYVC